MDQLIREWDNRFAHLAELRHSLAKQHAFAIVAHAQGAAALLVAILKEPKLSSFLVLREPDIEMVHFDSLHGVLHPILTPFDPDGPVQLVRAARSLNAVLRSRSSTGVKFGLSATPSSTRPRWPRQFCASSVQTTGLDLCRQLVPARSSRYLRDWLAESTHGGASSRTARGAKAADKEGKPVRERRARRRQSLTHAVAARGTSAVTTSRATKAQTNAKAEMHVETRAEMKPLRP